MAGEKVAIVTGSTRGIGFDTARKLAELGFHVIVTGRGQGAVDDAAKRLASAVEGAQVEGQPLDLASFADIRRFADAFKARRLPLQLLVNNAGAMFGADRSGPQTPTLTADGLEATLQTNAVGPFLLTQLLLDALLDSAPSRVVNVASRAHLPKSGYGAEVNWDWDNLKGERGYEAMRFYKNSKLATMWFTYELARRLEGKGVTVNAVCPGFVPATVGEHAKGFQRVLFKYVMPWMPGARTLDQASQNTVFAATHPTYGARSGAFIGEEREVTSSEQAQSAAEARRFWEYACSVTGIPV